MNLDKVRVAIIMLDKVSDIIEDEISTAENEEEALSGHLDAVQKVLTRELAKTEKKLKEGAV